MKKLLALVLILLFIILAWFGWKWYKNTVLCCNANVQTETKENVTPVSSVVKYGPLVYNWNSGKPITNNLWADKKNEIQSADGEGKILKITGPYYKEEANNTSFENIGLARADAVRQMLSDSIDMKRMEIDSKLVSESNDARTAPFGGTILDWKVRNENIQEVEDKTLIYFPYNSTKKLENVNINDYLKGVVEKLKDNDKTISLTGHTDNKGNPGYNMRLGFDRAKSIKSILMDLGVAENRISVGTSGENEPIASNDTEEGMEKNRRVELEIK